MDVVIRLSPDEARTLDEAMGVAASSLSIVGNKAGATAMRGFQQTLRDRYAEATAVCLVTCSDDEEIMAWAKANNVDVDDVLKSIETIRERLRNA